MKVRRDGLFLRSQDPRKSPSRDFFRTAAAMERVRRQCSMSNSECGMLRFHCGRGLSDSHGMHLDYAGLKAAPFPDPRDSVAKGILGFVDSRYEEDTPRGFSALRGNWSGDETGERPSERSWPTTSSSWF